MGRLHGTQRGRGTTSRSPRRAYWSTLSWNGKIEAMADSTASSGSSTEVHPQTSWPEWGSPSPDSHAANKMPHAMKSPQRLGGLWAVAIQFRDHDH
jgi:hypothetical protein